MGKYRRTKEGKKINYNDIGLDHLCNIIKFIKRRASEGLTIRSGGGTTAGDMWYDEYTIYGEEVLKKYDYYGLEDEFNRRGI